MNSQKRPEIEWAELESEECLFVKCLNNRLDYHMREPSWKEPRHPVVNSSAFIEHLLCLKYLARHQEFKPSES